jgi:hypothetical protein
MTIENFPQQLFDLYEVHEWNHAVAILRADFPNEWKDIVQVLTSFRLKKGYISAGGGNKSLVSQVIDKSFTQLGWREVRFDTKVSIQPIERSPAFGSRGAQGLATLGQREDYNSPTHNVDCFKNKVALEIEWNNKDPFFDRDLNNFRLLFELRAAHVGVIITRCDELQEIFVNLGRGSSYGNSTTHMSKLLPRIEGGGGGGCPILVFGIRSTSYVDEDDLDAEAAGLVSSPGSEPDAETPL